MPQHDLVDYNIFRISQEAESAQSLSFAGAGKASQTVQLQGSFQPVHAKNASVFNHAYNIICYHQLISHERRNIKVSFTGISTLLTITSGTSLY